MAQFRGNKGLLPTNIQYYMRLSQRQMYHRESFVGSSYYYMKRAHTIASFLFASLKAKERTHTFSEVTHPHNKSYIEYVYLIRTENFLSKYITLSYLIKFPLLSYKYTSVIVLIELLRISLNK